MLHGCGNSQCKQVLCDNGRQNAAGRPIRRYTPRSARTIALTLASGQKPRLRFCARLDHPTSRSNHNLTQTGEGPRDPSSVVQLLADSAAIKQLCGPEQSTSSEPLRDASFLPGSRVVSAIRACHVRLDNAESLLNSSMQGGSGRKDAVQLLDIVFEVIQILFTTLPSVKQATAKWYGACLAICDRLVQNGKTRIPITASTKKQLDPHIATVTELLDVLDDLPRIRLLQRCLGLVVRLAGDEKCVWSSIPGLAGTNGPYSYIARCIHDHCIHKNVHVLTIWLKLIFFREWDGEGLLHKWSVPMACLNFIKIFDGVSMLGHEWGKDGNRLSPYLIFVPSRINADAMAASWLERLERPDSIQPDGHLLDFPCLFTEAQLALYFRTINHVRMRRAHNDAEKAAILRGRMMQNSFDVDFDARLTFLEDHYLMLTIGRNNVLQDGFNQIWQRRSSELLRPLRVRLGEIDAFEVGHDLGGVQIEFFNLLCKEAFSEELGMFTSDPKTGMSFFRPGCLQPLYTFELLGVLFALAVYNGITLPVNLPLAFYAKLLNFSCEELSFVADGWPEMHRALKATLKEDIPDLDYAFALEANGVRLAISSYEEEPERETPKTTARVADATAISSSVSTPIEPQNLNWPGWSFEPASPHEAIEVNPQNKAQYVKQYIIFLTYASVAAQWHHFLAGFHRILPHAHLTFFTPWHLRAIVEGTRNLSIPDLRATTTYEGYAPEGPYITAFWGIVEAWSKEKQKQLLKFVTAAERLPVGGAKDVTFRVHRVGHEGSEEALPTSSTCFGTLYLPKYPSGEVLERKLTVALEMGGEGFGNG